MMRIVQFLPNTHKLKTSCIFNGKWTGNEQTAMVLMLFYLSINVKIKILFWIGYR